MDSEIKTSFSEILQELRQDAKMTQKQLAKEMGISKPSVSKYEQGSTLPEYATLIKLAKFFNVNLEYLLGLSRISITLDDIQKALTVDGELLNLDDLYSLTDPDKKLLIEIVRMMREREPYTTPVNTKKASGRK